MLNNKKNIKPIQKQNKNVKILENIKPLQESPKLNNFYNNNNSNNSNNPSPTNSPKITQYNAEIEKFKNLIKEQEYYIADLIHEKQKITELLNTKHNKNNNSNLKKLGCFSMESNIVANATQDNNDNSNLKKLGCFSMESNIVANATQDNNDTNYKILNNWDSNNNKTIRNWFDILKEYKFIYQSILDKNYKNSIKYNIASIIFSSALGFFSAFKLWLPNEIIFQSASNIIMLFSNFFIAALTHIATRFIDDKRNEKIRIYIEAIDNLLGVITAQLSKNSNLRMDAIKFINDNNDKYTNILTNKPSLSFDELTEGKIKYKNYQKVLLEVKVSAIETQTEIQIDKQIETQTEIQIDEQIENKVLYYC